MIMMTVFGIMPMVTTVIIVTDAHTEGIKFILYSCGFLGVKICLRFTVVDFYNKCSVIVD